MGLVGATQNYGLLSGASKMILVGMMLIGRLEIFAILALFAPSFWRER